MLCSEKKIQLVNILNAKGQFYVEFLLKQVVMHQELSWDSVQVLYEQK